MSAPTHNESVAAWHARGRMIYADSVEVFAVDTRPGSSEPAWLWLHGFPTSSHDFHPLLPAFSDRRVVTLDLPGYGLSEKPARRDYSLFRQADVVERTLEQLGVDVAHVVAHDMGTSVACELLARREHELLSFDVRSLVLMNGSVHIDMARLTPSQRLLLSPIGPAFARLANRVVFERQMRRIVTRLEPDDLDAMWRLLVHRDGKLRLPAIIRYVDERRTFASRWIGALEHLDLPTHVMWGTEDPVAVLAIGERLASEIPDASLERLDGLGHYPQLEDPARVAQALRRFYDRIGA